MVGDAGWSLAGDSLATQGSSSSARMGVGEYSKELPRMFTK